MQRQASVRKYKSDSQRRAIFHNIALNHQGLVRKVVRPYAYRNPHLTEDLISAGNTGLLEFIKRYNPTRSKFSTGATQAIRAKVLKEIYKGKTVRVPEKAMSKMAKLGPLPTTTELKDIMGHSSAGGIERVEARATLSGLMKSLSPQEKTVLTLRMQGQPLSVIARRAKVSSNRVARVHSKALKKMKARAS